MEKKCGEGEYLRDARRGGPSRVQTPWAVSAYAAAIALLLTSAAVMGGSTTYTYDELGRLKSVSYDPSSAKIDYVLDAAGNRVSQTVSFDAMAPSVPTGLSGSAISSTQVNLTWTASTDAGGSGLAGYKIYRGGSEIGTSATTNFSDTSAIGTTLYSYTVAAYDNRSNLSAPSVAFVVTTPDTNAPSTPTALMASAPSSTQVNLSWTASTDTGGSGLAGYKVYRGGAEIGSSTFTSYTDGTVIGTTQYSYTVAAYDNQTNLSGQSAASVVTTPDTIAPSNPTGLTGSAPSSTQVTLSWTASSDTGGSGVAGYKVYRGGSEIGSSATANYADNAVSGMTQYSYTVAAYDNQSNLSGQSGAFVVTTPDTLAPSVPSGLGGSAPQPTQVNLNWTGSSDTGGSGLVGYKLYRNGGYIGATSSTSYSDTTVAAQTAYTYTVTAYDGASNESSQSSVFSVTTPSNVPSVPGKPTPVGIVTATPWNVIWSASSGPVSYYILRRTRGTTVTDFTISAPTVTSSQSAANGQSQSFKVQACNSSNECSAFSASSTITYCKNGLCP